MTDQAIRVVPAGWYEDPASAAHVRWWNGLAWTEHTAPKPSAAPQPQPVAQTPWHDTRTQDGQQQELLTTATGSIHTAETLARIAAARELERQYGISTAEHDIIMRAARDGEQPAASDTRAAHRAWEPEPEEFDEPGTSTASVWFIALWPLLTLAAAAAAGYLAFYVLPDPSVAGIPVAAAVVLIPSLLTLIWAATDARRLRSLGHRPPSPALALFGPLVYLIARRTRVPGSGPLAALLVLTVLAIGAPVAAVLAGAAVPVTKALEIQQEVHAAYVAEGRLASVSCPVFVEDLAQGSLYTCNGTLPNGGAKIVWVSIDSNSGDFSYALAVK